MTERDYSIADMVADPLGTITRMRAHGAVVPIEFGVMVVQHEAVKQTLSARELRPNFSEFLHQMGVTSGPFHDWMRQSPLDMDGEEHKPWRALLSRTFTPRSVEKLRPFLAAEARRLTAELPASGNCDFVDAFARKLPSLGLCELIGVPSEDRDVFSRWADTIGFGFNLMLVSSKIEEIDAALSELLDFAGRLVQQRRAEPRDDLVTRLAQAVDEEGGFSEEKIRSSVAGLVFAGHETTKNQLGWMVSVLADVPAEWDRVAAEATYAHAVVEEVLRLRSTATSVGRSATEDMEIGGTRIEKGTRLIASLWAANRDPAMFPEPERFDTAVHAADQHFAFGHGAHFCLGAALARAELQEALVALTASLKCPRLLEGSTWLPPIGINGPLTLPIAFERRS